MYNFGLILEMFIELLWPDKHAIKFQEPLLISGTTYSPQILPPVEEIKEPSEDHESLLLIDIPIAYLKYDVIYLSSVIFLKF